MVVRFVVPDLWQSRGDPWVSRSQRVDSQHVCGDQVASVVIMKTFRGVLRFVVFLWFMTVDPLPG